MPRRPGSKNQVTAPIAGDPEDAWWDGVVEGAPIVQWMQWNDEQLGKVLTSIVEVATGDIALKLNEIERLRIVSELDVDLYTTKALESLAAIRAVVDWGVHVVIDASLARGGVSERRLAQAAGISNHTVKQWRSTPVSFTLAE